MREIRTSGSEGGAAQANAPSLPLSFATHSILLQETHRPRDSRAACCIDGSACRVQNNMRHAAVKVVLSNVPVSVFFSSANSTPAMSLWP